jgi:diaminopimelate decarboxylase
VLKELGAGVDIVSGGELYRAMRAGFTPSAVVFSGVGKSVPELSEAIRVGVGLINIESRAELDVLTRLASEVSEPIELGIRINPDVTVDTHPYTRTGTKGMKFGVSADDVIEIARTIKAQPHLKLTGVGVHIGSQIRDADSFREAAGRLREVVYQLRGVGVEIRRVDVGGGLGIRYRYEEVLSPEEYADALSPLADLDVELVLEPGRFLVGNAGVLLTTCIYMKRSGGRVFTIVDGGMNDLVRPSWYQAEHEITVVSTLEPGANTETVDVVGPLCEAGDFLGLERELTGVHAGAVLAVHGAGAYGFAMSSNYNSRPRAAEVVIDGDRWAVTRDRETMTDLVRGERSLEDVHDADWFGSRGGVV